MSLRDYILKNFWLKVFSVALAAFIWVVIESGLRVEKWDMKMPFFPFRSQETHDYRLPVAVLASPTNQLALKLVPSEVTVSVRGDWPTLAKLDPDEIEVFVNVGEAPNLDGPFVVKVNAPRDVSIQQIIPAQVYVLTARPHSD
jgi:hypothetical protein